MFLLAETKTASSPFTTVIFFLGIFCIIFGILTWCGLPLIGFGAAGVIAGTFAAMWHASIGNVAAGGVFAILQSIGATGACFGAVKAGLALVVGSSGVGVVQNWFAQEDDSDEECERDEL